MKRKEVSKYIYSEYDEKIYISGYILLLDSSDDLNLIDVDGLALVNGSKNRPANSGHGLLHSKGANSERLQVYYELASNNKIVNIYTRVYNESWGVWSRTPTEENIIRIENLVNSLAEDVEEAKELVDNLGEVVDGLSDDVETLRSEVNALATEVEQAEEDIINNGEAIRQTNNNVTQLTARVVSNEGILESVRTTTEEIEYALEEHYTQYDELVNRVAEDEERLNALSPDAYISRGNLTNKNIDTIFGTCGRYWVNKSNGITGTFPTQAENEQFFNLLCLGYVQIFQSYSHRTLFHRMFINGAWQAWTEIATTNRSYKDYQNLQLKLTRDANTVCCHLNFNTKTLNQGWNVLQILDVVYRPAYTITGVVYNTDVYSTDSKFSMICRVAPDGEVEVFAPVAGSYAPRGSITYLAKL